MDALTQAACNDSASPPISPLPHPRQHPLRAGSGKEETLRQYLEISFLQISRKYAKKFLPAEPGPTRDGTVRGYMSMSEVARDLSDLIDIVWLSGTPSLQIPHFLQIAGIINTYVIAFPPAPEVTFLLLHKLDHVFSSLITGNDFATGECLPGFSGKDGRVLTKTDMVRLKSLVEETRVLAVNLLEKFNSKNESSELNMTNQPDEPGEHDMNVAQIYVQTVIQLGKVMDPIKYHSLPSELK